MNRKAILHYISLYKKHFQEINSLELYKWKAIKQFQDSFDIDASDFAQNLETALSKTGNLLLSRNHFPKGMILKNANSQPEKIRNLFRMLYEEELNIVDRIIDFKEKFKLISEDKFPGEDHYQYHHSIFVYLTLRYPDLYYFYKFGTVKEFAEMVDFPSRFRRGNHDNIGLFITLCDAISELVQEDQELIIMHESRLDEDCYRDQSLHVLAQDVLYSAVRHLPHNLEIDEATINYPRVKEESSVNYFTEPEEVQFKAAIINHLENQRRNERLGTAGELWVMDYEKNYLLTNGKPKLAEMVEHTSKVKGDGVGFDILSRELDGKKKFIEVKTTSGPLANPFYMTSREKERSVLEGEQYVIYRLYNFEKKDKTSDLLIIRGNQAHLCVTAVSYKVTLMKKSED